VEVTRAWVLTQGAFDVLLARLHPDQQQAGQRYEEIRRGLITFFECRGSSAPDDHADETINRVARRLVEGHEIFAANPAAYFYGVAKNVLKEQRKSAAAMFAPLESLPNVKQLADDPHELERRRTERVFAERRLACLEQCLETLADGDRSLIAHYYHGEAAVKVRNRKLLASQLAIPINALRIRALRIREKLEACVEQRLRLDARR
jgi:DNA-directed RNA polymerase specialized sigma24 family protein